MDHAAIRLNAGISIAVDDRDGIFPYERSITLPNITFTSPLVNAPVPIQELKLNFSADPGGEKLAGAIRQAKEVPYRWLHCPYVSVLVVTDGAPGTKERILKWKEAHAHKNVKLLLVFAPMKNIKPNTEEGNLTKAKTDPGLRGTTHSHGGVVATVCKTYETCSGSEVKAAEQALKPFANNGDLTFVKLVRGGGDDQKQSGLGFRRRSSSGSKGSSASPASTAKLNWQSIVFHIIELSSSAFASRCLLYQEKIRLLETANDKHVWHIGLHVLTKECLGLLHVQVNLVTVALQLYSEISAFLSDLPKGPLLGIACDPGDDFAGRVVVPAADKADSTLLDAYLDPCIHERVRQGQAGLLELLFYLFARQINLLEHIGLYDQLHLRSSQFLKEARPLFRKHVSAGGRAGVETIDILTICLVAHVKETMDKHEVLQKGNLPKSQKVDYGFFLLLGRASCMRVVKQVFSPASVAWSHGGSEHIDPTTTTNPLLEDSDDDDRDAAKVEIASIVESSMCQYLLDRHRRTKCMFDDAKNFHEFVKAFILVPTFEIYTELGLEYKRHLLYVAVDLAYMCLIERDYSSAAKYFETADSIYVQDHWKRYETINSTWLAYTYRHLLHEGAGEDAGNEGTYSSYKYKYIDALLSLVHTDAINACPELLPFVVSARKHFELFLSRND